ncbi:hypothetical protein KSP39_PZI007490 [Platanthera zijinensis]|uniref:Uncharacterized protein n=1 Tax=Platanthera zijinensis TaxID=2320716 RepID=A0AAP0BQQ6_9ASPA
MEDLGEYGELPSHTLHSTPSPDLPPRETLILPLASTGFGIKQNIEPSSKGDPKWEN